MKADRNFEYRHSSSVNAVHFSFSTEQHFMRCVAVALADCSTSHLHWCNKCYCCSCKLLFQLLHVCLYAKRHIIIVCLLLRLLFHFFVCFVFPCSSSYCSLWQKILLSMWLAVHLFVHLHMSSDWFLSCFANCFIYIFSRGSFNLLVLFVWRCLDRNIR